MTAEQFKEYSEDHSQDEIEAMLDKISFQNFNVMVQAKYSTFQGDTRCNFYAVKVLPQNPALESRALLQRMQLYENKKAGDQEYEY